MERGRELGNLTRTAFLVFVLSQKHLSFSLRTGIESAPFVGNLVRFFIAITDSDWFSYLSTLGSLDEVNFWQRSGSTNHA